MGNNDYLKVSESDVKKQIKSMLTMYGWFCMNIAQNAFAQEGIPDMICISKQGTTAYIEVKRPYIKGVQAAGVLSDAQKAVRAEIEKRDGLYIVAYSLDDILPYVGQQKLPV